MAVFSVLYKLCSEIHSVRRRLRGINIVHLYVCETHGSWQYPICRRGSFAFYCGFPYRLKKGGKITRHTYRNYTMAVYLLPESNNKPEAIIL